MEKIKIERVAGHAVNTRGVCQGLEIRDSVIAECGAGGIYAGGEATLIENNLVRDVGLSYPSAIGIYRGGKNSTVRHNEVHDTSYSAINYGGEKNRIEANWVHHCMKVLHDGAAIYVFGAKETVIRANRISDITNNSSYGASAIYLDEQSTGCLVEDNLIERVPWIFQNHLARENIIRHNVAWVDGDARLAFARSQSYLVENNVIVATGKIEIQNPGAITQWRNNLLSSGKKQVAQRVLVPDGYKTEKVIEGAPEGTTSEDPQMVDRAQGDYRFRAGSITESLGIEPLDGSHAGRISASQDWPERTAPGDPSPGKSAPNE